VLKISKFVGITREGDAQPRRAREAGDGGVRVPVVGGYQLLG
jgi:hypothetical protein